MNLSHLMNAVVTSQLSDWHRLSYVGPLHHSEAAVFLDDVTLSLAFGHTDLDDFQEPWAKQFSDPTAYSAFADVFYQGTLVYRASYVGVDGDRAKLPIPDIETMEVPRRYVQFTRLVDELAGISEFDSYFRRARLKISDAPWPEFRQR